ncbi:MAG: hypothetical protein IPI00_02935 [Flavobacteriales bacterium]|nr:hypothetical protein [Flavobacteriales bacterium]MBK6945928.1 hypothetical protein [Flavobacteriales bacterium]MBK7239137.1 hypothetical protein [Flavobacteriales bacterium]MBK9536757.1 hypothetical protein [Flavobacteriales bacterium]MBP9138237.1 hypothetical protein [Flavobacteriales bacterium]
MAVQNKARITEQNWESPELVVEFWTWFKQNQRSIERLAEGDREMLPVYEEMTHRMHGFHPNIFPELSLDDAGGYILIVTADGRNEGLEPVMHFTELYPVIEGWQVQRFRKPVNDPLAVFEYHDLIVALAEVNVAYAYDPENELIHVGLVIEGASREDERWLGMMYILMDHAIGEYNTMTYMGSLDLMAIDELPENVTLITMDELREVFEEEFY